MSTDEYMDLGLRIKQLRADLETLEYAVRAGQQGPATIREKAQIEYEISKLEQRLRQVHIELEVHTRRSV